MSDPKRANLITVGAPKCAKKIVSKTVRLTINLVESNESKYPELNYKELVIAEERKQHVENGKTGGLDPFSDNDEDVERVAKKFEQKYGNNSPHRKKKRRSKNDDFADIGAGYDENDSFIDNTHGYDEMIPPNIDTLHGGFYINCGSLEFKTVPNDESGIGDEPRRNKRRISSSSSEEESSESSSDSESQDTKDPKAITNGTIDSHKTEHRKKKNKKVDKQKAKKVRRADSSAATSGKQTSDDNIHPEGEGESVDSRTSHSDSLTSKPALSSENAITSDSSRDTESKTDNQLPTPVTEVLDALEASIAKHLIEHPTTSPNTLLANNEIHIQRLELVLSEYARAPRACRGARARAARALGVSRARLAPRDRCNAHSESMPILTEAPPETVPPAAVSAPVSKNKRKLVEEDNLDISLLSEDQRQNMMLETIKRLMDLIEEFKPSMFANYNLECERVREEKKKLTSDGATVEKRLPKRRFPWCHRSRSLLYRITKLAGSQQAGAMLLAEKILPLFPKGFVRMPTLMRQANIGKDIKVPEIKRQRLGSSNHIPLNIHSQTIPPSNIPPTNIPPTVQTPPLFVEPIQFPSSLTVTATNVKSSPEKTETQNKDINLGHIMNSYAISKDLIVEREKSEKKEEVYIPPNNIGSITITAVPSQSSRKEKKTEKAPHKTDKSSNHLVQKTSVPDRQPSSVAKTSVPENRQSSSVPKTSVPDNRQSSSVPKTSVPDNRQSSSVPKTSVPDNRQSSSVPKTTSVTDNRQSSSLPKTSVPDNRQSSSVPKTTSVTDNRQSSSVPKTTSVTDNRQSSSVPKTSVPDNRQSSSVPKTSVPDNRQSNSLPKTGVPENRQSSSVPKTSVPDNRQSSSVPKTSVPDNWQQILLQKASVSDTRHHSTGHKSTASDIRHTSSSQKTSPTDTRQPSSHKTSVTDSRLPMTKPTTDTKSNIIRVKSPAALNDLFKKDTTKKPDKAFSNPEKSHPNPKDRRLDTPLQIETNFHTTRKEPSPKNKDSSPRSKDSVSQKQIESLRVKENNIPRPALVPVHLSPTFAKPDKRPEKKKEVEKKKEIMIVSDLDPLSEPLSDDDPVAIDDSSSDVEVIENDRIESVVPLKDIKVPKNDEVDDIDRLMRNIREMEHSQEPTKFNSNSFSGVIDNSIAKHRIPPQGNVKNNIGNRNDKFAERTSLKKTDGCNGVTD